MLLPVCVLAVLASGPEPLTLREAAALAASDAPAVARAAADSVRARAGEAAVRSRLGPSLSLDFGAASTNDPVNAFSLALKQERFSAAEFFASDPNHPGFVRDWNAGLTAAWNIDLFGAARGEARSARAEADAATRTAHRAKDATVAEAVAAFAAARQAQSALQLLAGRKADAEKDVSIASALAEQGFTTRADPARARAALSEVLAEIAGRRSALEQARASLAVLIGQEAASRPLAELPETRSAAEETPGERDDVAAAELAARAARDLERAATGSRWPTLLVLGRYELHAPSPGGRWGDSASVFGGFRMPLFASGGVASRIAEARASALSADAAALQARRQADREIASARAALDAARAREAAFAEAEAAAGQAREIQQARYEEGVARLADLLEARAAELHARLGALSARSERAVAHANLRLALGLPPVEEESP